MKQPHPNKPPVLYDLTYKNGFFEANKYFVAAIMTNGYGMPDKKKQFLLKSKKFKFGKKWMKRIRKIQFSIADASELLKPGGKEVRFDQEDVDNYLKHIAQTYQR